MQTQGDKDMQEQTFEPKFVKEDRGTISGAAIGIASALAAQRIAEAETIRNKAKKIERDAEIIASTLLETVMPDTKKAIADYMTSYVDGKARSDAELCEVLGSLYAEEATSLNAKRTLAVEQIIAEDPHGITPLCAVFAKGQDFMDTMDKWVDNDYEHKQMAAKQTASTDLKTLYAEARESLIAHDIIDENGNITDKYCEDVKKRAGLSKTPESEAVSTDATAERNAKPSKRIDLQEAVPMITLGETDTISPADFHDDATQAMPLVVVTEEVAAEEPEKPAAPEEASEPFEDEAEKTQRFVIPGFEGIGTGDPYSDIIEESRDEALDDAADMLTEKLSDTTPAVTDEEPTAEVSDLDNTIVMDPLDELDDEPASPAITGDLGEAASAIAEIVEETHSTDAVDTELVKEAILETVAEADDELVEALASVEDKPAIEEITELVASAAIAEAHIDELDEEELEDIEIVPSEEVEKTDDSTKAAMFTESFMAITPEQLEDAADADDGDEKDDE